jgi:hypothetical protein
MANAIPGEAYERETQRDVMGDNEIQEGNDILGKFNPGLGAQRFDVMGAAKFIPKGSDLVFELHYTTSGEPTSDISKVGIVLAKQAPRMRYYFHGPSLLPRGESGPTLASLSRVGPTATGKASSASTGGGGEP